MLRPSKTSTLAGQPVILKLYDTIRRSWYWPHIKNDMYTTMDSCPSSPKNCGHPAHQIRLKIFPVGFPLENNSINILGTCPKTKRGNYHFVIITDLYIKLTLKIRIYNISSASVSNGLLNNFIIPYGISKSLLAKKRTAVRHKFFFALCTFLGTDLSTTTAYHQ